MQPYQLIDDAQITEPISLSEAKAYMMIDADYASDDADISLLISTARERLEQYLNVGLAEREVTLQWPGNPIELPLSPNGAITSLKDKDNVDVPTDKYTASAYRDKTILVNSQSSSGIEWFYAIDNSYVTAFSGYVSDVNTIYKLVYVTGYDVLPKALKQAILAEVDYLYKLRGMPVTDLVSPNAKLLAHGYSKNLVL